MSLTIEQDLKDILAQMNQTLNSLQTSVTGLAILVAKIETKLEAVDQRIGKVEDDIKDLGGSTRTQIWALIGILGTAVLGILAAGSKLLFFGSNP